MKIDVCMGSSCFARGNNDHLEALLSRPDSGRTEVRGHLCAGCCAEGPVVTIDGNRYTAVTEERLCELVATHEGVAP